MENDASHQVKLIKSRRGGQKLAEGGYIYDKQKIYGEITHWQCEKKGECKARLHTKGMSSNEHFHGSDAGRGLSRCRGGTYRCHPSIGRGPRVPAM